MLKNSVDSYGWLAIALHWITAFTVFGLFALGLWMVELDYYSNWYKSAPDYHKSIGLLLAALVLLRVVWKFAGSHPRPLGNSFEQKAAVAAHGLLYLLLMTLFFSGYLITTADGRAIDIFSWFSLPSMGELIENQEDIAGEIHQLLAFGLVGLSLLHGVAALKHHFMNKDQTLVRMLKPTSIYEDEL